MSIITMICIQTLFAISPRGRSSAESSGSAQK